MCSFFDRRLIFYTYVFFIFTLPHLCSLFTLNFIYIHFTPLYPSHNFLLLVRRILGGIPFGGSGIPEILVSNLRNFLLIFFDYIARSRTYVELHRMRKKLQEEIPFNLPHQARMWPTFSVSLVRDRAFEDFGLKVPLFAGASADLLLKINDTGSKKISPVESFDFQKIKEKCYKFGNQKCGLLVMEL